MDVLNELEEKLIIIKSCILSNIVYNDIIKTVMENRRESNMCERDKARITKEQIEELIKLALDQLYERDRYLVDNRPFLKERNGNHHVGERSIVFRLAHYMQNYMDSNPKYNDYVLDCEYNRNGVHAKKLPSFEKGVYPDVIIHNRGNNDNNILIMEVKTYWNDDNSHDLDKIREFIDIKGEYRFMYGVSLFIGRNRREVTINFLTNSNCDER
jgi:hypothetical protein